MYVDKSIHEWQLQIICCFGSHLSTLICNVLFLELNCSPTIKYCENLLCQFKWVQKEDVGQQLRISSACIQAETEAKICLMLQGPFQNKNAPLAFELAKLETHTLNLFKYE